MAQEIPVHLIQNHLLIILLHDPDLDPVVQEEGEEIILREERKNVTRTKVLIGLIVGR